MHGLQHEAALMAALAARDVLRPGQDVELADSWGLDCYTRRNIVDAVRSFRCHVSV